MPNRSTRAALPAAAMPPEYTAAAATLASSTPKSVTKAAFRPVGTTCHSVSHSRPANSPSAANSMERCGPESPSGIGNGGRSSAAPKKSASQRAGFCRVHQRRGMRTAGAASAAFRGTPGARAMAAAQMPNSAGIHQAGRGSDALVTGPRLLGQVGNRAGDVYKWTRSAGCQPAAGCHPAPQSSKPQECPHERGHGSLKGCSTVGGYSSRALPTVRKVVRASGDTPLLEAHFQGKE